jgi:hypothetical protein
VIGEVENSVSSHRFVREFVLPATFPLVAVALTLALIVAVGEILLSLYDANFDKEYDRLELWVATAAALAILAIAGFLASRPAGSLGKLDQPLMIGSHPLLADPPPPVDELARRGVPGTIDDLGAGYALYARHGQIGVAREMLRDVASEVGHLRKGFIYAQGVHGATDRMWIPIEAVSAVYPETKSAFLAIAGDEIEAYGWDNPPPAFNLRRKVEEYKLY